MVGMVMRNLRTARGESLEQLSTAVGIPLKRLERIEETGHGNLRLDQLERLATHFGTTSAKILEDAVMAENSGGGAAPSTSLLRGRAATLGGRLNLLRTRRRETLFETAAAVGASKAHIWEIERDRSKNPSLDLLQRLSTHFGTSVAYLIGEKLNSSIWADEFIQRNGRKLAELGEGDLMLLERILDRLHVSIEEIIASEPKSYSDSHQQSSS